jgi:hypothetical protein
MSSPATARSRVSTASKKKTTTKAKARRTNEATKAAKPAKAVVAPVPAEPTDPPVGDQEVVGFGAAFERFRAEAEAVADRDVVPLRSSLPLALHNARLGLALLTNAGGEDAIAELPGVKLAELRTVPDLIGAALLADRQIERSGKQDDLPALLAEARGLRRRLLAAAESLAVSNRLRERDVAKIRPGSSVLDAAADCVALAALYQKQPAVLRETPLKMADIKRAGELGTRLLTRLKPRFGRRAQDLDRQAATALRDKFWTLAVARYRDAWRVAAFLLGPEIEGSWPALQARVGRKAKTKTETKTSGDRTTKTKAPSGGGGGGGGGGGVKDEGEE